MSTVTRWWWIRHAPVPDGGRIYGQSDLDCDCGDVEIFRILARELPRGAVWVTSNLARTRQTAAAILAAAQADRFAAASHGHVELPERRREPRHRRHDPKRDVRGNALGRVRGEAVAVRDVAEGPRDHQPIVEDQRSPASDSGHDADLATVNLMDRFLPAWEDELERGVQLRVERARVREADRVSHRELE